LLIGRKVCKSILAQFAEAGKKAQQSLTPAVDWLDTSIGRGGLVLVVSHLFAIPILVLWVGLEKSKCN
jgi:hypothetical protein